VSAYELFTGESPYMGKNQEEIIKEIINRRVKPQAPSKVKSGIHHNLDRIIMKALEKNPSNRYSSMMEMMLDFKRLSRSQI
jgi:serine/threonine-protein kinase